MRRMATLSWIAIVALCLVPGAGAQMPTGNHTLDGPVELAWDDRHDGPMSAIDRVSSVAMSPDGTKVYVTGESYGSMRSLDFLTLAYNASDGVLLWEARYDGPRSENDSAKQVLPAMNGEVVFVTGTSVGYWEDDWDYVTLAYDASDGALLWEQRFHSQQRGEGWTNTIAATSDGSIVFLNGRSDCHYDGRPANATVAYDGLSGIELWQACLDGCLSYGDHGAVLAVAPDDSKLFVAGTHVNGARGLDYATLAYDASNGALLWTSYYDNGLNPPGSFPTVPIPVWVDPTYDSPRGIAVSPDGGALYVTGESSGKYGLTDYATVAYDAETGEQRRVARFDGSAGLADTARAIAVGPDGRTIVVTGESRASAETIESVTIAYTRDLGSVRWIARSTSPGSFHDTTSHVAISRDGKTVLLAGQAWGESSADWAVSALDVHTGEQVWSAHFDGVTSHADFVRGIAVNGSATVVAVAGHSCGCSNTGEDFVTAVYVAELSETAMDVKPGSCQNPIGSGAKGVLPVTVFGSADFHVLDVDLATVTLEGLAPVRHTFELAGAPCAGPCCIETPSDGHVDLKLKFDAAALLETLGEPERGETLEVMLSGSMKDGTPFHAVDTISIVGGPPWVHGTRGPRTRVERGAAIRSR